jgi:hypothetical protein
VRLALLRLLLQHAQPRLGRRELLAERLGARAGGGARGARLLQLAAQHVGLGTRRAAVAQRGLEAVGAPLLLTRRLLLCARQLRLERRHTGLRGAGVVGRGRGWLGRAS